MNALWPIMHKEAIHILRDGRSLAAALLLPVLMLALFGYAIRFDVTEVEIAVLDQDRSPESRALIERLAADGSVQVIARPSGEVELDELLQHGDVRLGLVLPRGMGADLGAGRVVPVQLVVDGSEATFAGQALSYVGGALQSATLSDVRTTLRQVGGTGEVPGLSLRPRVFFNETLDGRHFVVPGLIAIIIMMIAALLTSQCVAREYEHNTIEQILVSPVNGLALMVGKLVPYIAVGVIQVVGVTILAQLVFDVPIRGSLLLLAVATLLYLTGAMALGLTISAVLKSQQVAMQVAMIATMLPSIILSGFVFPIDNMPWLLRVISHIIPARYFVSISRGLFLKGVGVEVLWPDLLAMVVFAVVLLAVATSRFRRTLA